MAGKKAQTEWLMLQPRPDYGDHDDQAWECEAIARGILCGECKFRLPHTAGESLDVRLWENPTPRPFGRLTVSYIARADFVTALKAVGPDLLEQFGIGGIILPNGKLSEQYVSLSPQAVVTIRGGPKSTRNYCGTCGRFRYFPMPSESRHLIKGTFDESRRLHAGELGIFVVRPQIWEQIPAVFKKKIKAWPLPVRDDPLDGIKDFPTLWP